MAIGQITATMRTGPAVQNTSLVIPNVVYYETDLERQVLMIRQRGVAGLKQFDLSTVTTVTSTLTGAAGNWTIALS